MCLKVVTAKGVNLEGVGWKVFRDTMESGCVKGEFHDTFMPVNKWIKKGYCAKASKHNMTPVRGYKTGFHVLANREAAIKWVDRGRADLVMRVKYRKGHTVGKSRLYVDGKSRWYRTIVADEIFICEKVK